jgi:hypothetical protein
MCMAATSGPLPLCTAAGSFWKKSVHWKTFILTWMFGLAELNWSTIFWAVAPSLPVQPFQNATVTSGPL